MHVEARSPRRMLQFSLRGLLLLVLLVAVFLGGRASVSPLIEAERARAKAAELKAQEAVYEMQLALHQQREIVHELDDQLQTSLRERVLLQSLDDSEAARRREQESDRIRDVTKEQAFQRRSDANGP